MVAHDKPFKELSYLFLGLSKTPEVQHHLNFLKTWITAEDWKMFQALSTAIEIKDILKF